MRQAQLSQLSLSHIMSLPLCIICPCSNHVLFTHLDSTLQAPQAYLKLGYIPCSFVMFTHSDITFLAVNKALILKA